MRSCASAAISLPPSPPLKPPSITSLCLINPNWLNANVLVDFNPSPENGWKEMPLQTIRQRKVFSHQFFYHFTPSRSTRILIQNTIQKQCVIWINGISVVFFLFKFYSLLFILLLIIQSKSNLNCDVTGSFFVRRITVDWRTISFHFNPFDFEAPTQLTLRDQICFWLHPSSTVTVNQWWTMKTYFLLISFA